MTVNPSPSSELPSQGPTVQRLHASVCPRCQGSVDRIPRETLDFMISFFVPVRRYRCLSIGCHWEGRLRRRRDAQPGDRSDSYAGRRPYL